VRERLNQELTEAVPLPAGHGNGRRTADGHPAAPEIRHDQSATGT
jgi:hypothetical protein